MEWMLYALLLLACPLMMLWCMRGMRSQESNDVPVEHMTPQAAQARLAEVQREELRLQERLLEDEPAGPRP